MATPSNRVLLMLAAFLGSLAVVLGGVLWLTKDIRPAGIIQQGTVGGPFQLTDQDGKAITEEAFRGKPFLVFFGFTHCPDVCPTTLFEVSEIMRKLGKDADRTAALFVSVDPERDTPEKLKDYLSSFDPHLRGATATPEGIAAVAKNYRVYYKKIPTTGDDYTMDHTALVYLMDKQGRFVAPFNIKRPPEASAEELRRFF
jgi:protein SCO1/2